MLTDVIALVLVSVLVAASAATVDPRCSRYSTGMKAQVLSYPQDCRKFVICDMGGNGQVLSCPQGLYFSDDAHACSFDMASCTHGELDGDRPEQSQPQPSMPVQPQPVPVPAPQAPQILPQPVPLPAPQAPQILPQPMPLPAPQPIPQLPVVPPPAVEIPDESQPQSWLPIVTAPPTAAEPVEEQSEVESLPPQSVGVPPRSRCCALGLINRTFPCFFLVFEQVCWDKAAGKIYPIAHDCGLYVVCMGDNNAIVQRCPRGLLYDHKQQRCEFADASNCAVPRVDAQLALDVHGVDLSLLEEEDRSDSVESDAELVVVPVKEDAATRVSELIQQDSVQPILIVPEPEQNRPEPVVEYRFRMIDNHPRCLARNNIHLTVELPHDTDCSMYLVCVGRVAIEKKCPAGQHWNAKHNWCDYAGAAGTAVTIVVTLSLVAVGLEAKVLATRDPRCPRADDPNKTVHLTHPSDCNRFLVCSSGMAYEMRCPDGLEYDVEQRSCDYDYLVRCSVDGRTQVQQANYGFEMPLEQLVQNRPSWNDLQEERMDVPVPQYKPAVSVVDARCPRTDDPMKPIHLPRTGNCGKFMKCFGGRAYEMDCPAGLEFDVTNSRCDYPVLARCSRV
uniref:Chitin-binding type-2 domain-containing protein n=1 Tax=Anopheles stephensi TaxID=30069 RepID=A0A182YC64_ANOST